MFDSILIHLKELVSCDTQNPPRSIGVDHPILEYCRSVLANCGCAISIRDLGDGCVWLFAQRGRASTLINCHLDTVPADGSWTRDPFDLLVTDDRAIGLGACDIKGAAACILSAAEQSDGAIALLLTTDEEAGQSRCVNEFVAIDRGYSSVIVAEPTDALAVCAHRGIATYEMGFVGTAMHSSRRVDESGSAVHQATRWCSRALDLASSPGFEDLRINIGVIEGGTKANVAASCARVILGMRPPPGNDPHETMRVFVEEVHCPQGASGRVRFHAPGLERHDGVDELIEHAGMETTDPVDFWTEAALFARAGYPTIVLGPGDITQAHSADEFVRLQSLQSAFEVYQRVFNHHPDENPQPGLKGCATHDA